MGQQSYPNGSFGICLLGGFMKIEETGFDSEIHIKEYKRKCNQCHKVWHTLASREEEIEKRIRSASGETFVNECDTCGSAQGIGNRAQINRNRDQNKSELDKLKQCPSCGSHDYKEEVLIYGKK